MVRLGSDAMRSSHGKASVHCVHEAGVRPSVAGCRQIDKVLGGDSLHSSVLGGSLVSAAGFWVSPGVGLELEKQAMEESPCVM